MSVSSPSREEAPQAAVEAVGTGILSRDQFSEEAVMSLCVKKAA